MHYEIILNDTIEVIVKADNNEIINHSKYDSNFAKIIRFTLEACPIFESYHDMFETYEIDTSVDYFNDYKTTYESDHHNALNRLVDLDEELEVMPFHQFGGPGYNELTQQVVARNTAKWAKKYLTKKFILTDDPFIITGEIANDNLYLQLKDEINYNTTKQYLETIRQLQQRLSLQWSPHNRNKVVGSYDAHNAWKDYDEYLFKDIWTYDKIALDYGAGPGRSIIQFSNRFARIDWIDIAPHNSTACKLNIDDFQKKTGIIIPPPVYYYDCLGDNISAVDKLYDVVYSVICLQHCCVHEVRYNIMREIYRVLKDDGYFCFQMGYGGKPKGKTWHRYHVNYTDIDNTNGANDVSITNISDLIQDLSDIGFTDVSYDIRPVGPGDNHANWIWVRAKK